MSPEQFNIWFPSIVGALFISLLAAALWDLLRRPTWRLVSRFWSGVLKHVGLDDNSGPTRTEVEEIYRVETETLSATATQIGLSGPANPSMAETADSTEGESSNSNSSRSATSSDCGGVINDSDVEAQTGSNPPTGKPVTFTGTAFSPDNTPAAFIRRAKKLCKTYAIAKCRQWKSSIVLQGSFPIDPCVLAEFGDLARDCMHAENRCTFQLGNWAILYYNAGEVRLHILKEGDVPVNVEARWQDERTGITMRGLYLNGAQVKVATKRTSTTLRSAGPAVRGPGDLDELHLPTEEVDVPGEDLLIYAEKVVEADGISLIVRSEASFILPPRENFSLIEVFCGRLQRILLSAMKMIKSFPGVKDRQPKTTCNRNDTLGPRHKVFISHSGAQKGLVEQLCVDLKRHDRYLQLCVDLERHDRYLYLDKRRSRLLIGKIFPKLSFEVIGQCEVGVVILSTEFFTRSKWPMLELVALTKNPKVVIIPVYLGISIEQVRDPENHKRWLRIWHSWAQEDERGIDIQLWLDAVIALSRLNGLVYDGRSKVSFREMIVEAVHDHFLPKTRLDLLTGDEWHSSGDSSGSPCTIPDDISPGDSTVASSSMIANDVRMDVSYVGGDIKELKALSDKNSKGEESVPNPSHQ